MRALAFLASLSVAFALIVGIGFAAHRTGVPYMSASTAAP